MRKLMWILALSSALSATGAAPEGEELIPVQDEDYRFDLRLEPEEGVARLETRRSNGQTPSGIRLRLERNVEPPLELELRVVERQDPRFPVYEARTKPFGGSFVAVAVELEFPVGPRRRIEATP